MEKETDPAFMDFQARRNKTRAQIIDIYNKEAEIYDETIKEIEFFVYEDIGEKLADFYSQNKESVRTLDICAGTGLVGVELSKRGFKNVDWLDPSEGMKKEALKKNVYTNYYLEFLDGHQIEAIKTDMYDCVTMSGGLNVGLVPCIGLLEMVRVTKPGGLVCFAALTSRYDAVEEYRNRLEPLMDWMEQDGIWSLLDRGTIAKYSKGSGPGVLYSFVVKANNVDVAKYEDKLQNQKKE